MKFNLSRICQKWTRIHRLLYTRVLGLFWVKGFVDRLSLGLLHSDAFSTEMLESMTTVNGGRKRSWPILRNDRSIWLKE